MNSKHIIATLRKIHSMDFATFCSIAFPDIRPDHFMDAGKHQSYLVDFYKDLQGNLFQALCNLDGLRSDNLFEWANKQDEVAQPAIEPASGNEALIKQLVAAEIREQLATYCDKDLVKAFIEQAISEREEEEAHQQIDEDELERKIESAVRDHTEEWCHDDFLTDSQITDAIGEHERDYDHNEFVSCSDDISEPVKEALKAICKNL